MDDAGLIVPLDDELLERLRIRALEHGRSVEDEALEILTSSLEEQPKPAPR